MSEYTGECQSSCLFTCVSCGCVIKTGQTATAVTPCSTVISNLLIFSDLISKGGVTLCNFLLASQHRYDTSCSRIARCNMSPLQLVSQHLCCSERCTKKNLVLLSIAVAQCNTPPAICLAMLCSISQSESLLSSPRSSSVAVLRVAGSPIAQCIKHPCSCNCSATLLNVARQVARKIDQCNSALNLKISEENQGEPNQTNGDM